MRTSCLLLVLLTAAAILTLTGSKALCADTTPPELDTLVPAANSTVVQLFEIEVFFNEALQGVDASDLLINGQPATSVTGSTPGVHRFSFTQAPTGTVQVAWAPGHGITDTAVPPNAFVPTGPWTYSLNPARALYDVRINEFLANNQTGRRDEDGSYQDWIELYNASPIAVPLDGCYLTDNRGDLTQWRFPAFTLPPDTYLVIWASNKNRTNNPAAIHTNFRLAPSGEYLGLIAPDGTNVVSEFNPNYPQQAADISYGRDPADPSIVGYYATPTFGVRNSTSGNGFAPSAQFSQEGGTFINPFNLTLSVPSTNAVIRYVLVNSAASALATVTNVPGTNSPIYTGPIPINLTTQVRVRVFEPGKLPSEPMSVTYIQISPDLTSFTSDLPIVIVHNFVGGAFGGSSTDKTAAIASFHADTERSSLTNKPDLMTRGAANDRGSSTGNQPKVNMAVEFWDEFNQDADRPFLNMPPESDWVLYGINAFDQSMMHNAIFHWFGNKVGSYSSRTRYVEVFLKVDGGPVTYANYHGVYLAEEKPKRNKNRVDMESLQPENTNAPSVTGGYLMRIDRTDGDERTFTVPSITTTTPINNTYGGQSIIMDYPNSIQWATDPRRASQRLYIQDYFTNFIRALTSTNFTDPVLGYAAYIDVDSWVKNNLVNTINFNADAYRLSGYFFKDQNKKIEQGPPWDCDRCAGAGGPPNNDNRPFHPRVFRIPTTSVGADNGTDFFGRSDVGVDWWDRLFRDPDFWQKYIDQYQQFRTNEFSDSAIVAMVDGFHNELKEAQLREHARWVGFTYPRSGVVTVGPYTSAGVTTPAYSYNFGPANPAFARGGYYTNEVAFQKKWLLDRLDFIDTNFLAMPVLAGSSGLVTNNTTVIVQAAPKPSTVILYTLNGTDPRLPGGTVSPQARTNLGDLSLTITSNIWLYARCYNTNHYNLTNIATSASVFEVGKPHSNSFWSGAISASYYTTNNPVPPLRITEIMYHPANPPEGNTNDQDNFEYLEVKNIGAAPLNVNRYRLRGGVDFHFPNVTLAPGEQAVVVRHLAAFQSRYGSGPRVLGSYTNDNLSNDGERLVLQGSLREPILDFSYDDSWHPVTDGAGFSLQIVNDVAATDTWGLKTSWRPSGTLQGTPGAADSGAVSLATIYVNEALTDTDPLLGDAIELYNPTVDAVNVGGWVLTDNFNTPKKFVIPSGTTIPANGYLVFYQSNSFGLDANSFGGTNGFALSSKGEEVYVFSADALGNLTGWANGYSFGPQASGVTFGRHIISTGKELFVTQSTPTLGTANSGPKVGPIVISEINYHPPDIQGIRDTFDNDFDEYIELQNISGASVPLYDPLNLANTWRLRDAVDFTFPTGVVMPAGSYVLLVSFDPSNSADLEEFRNNNGVPAGTPIYGPWNGQLDNSSDGIELVQPDLPDPVGTPTAGFVAYILADKVAYQDTLPWPTGLPDGLGAALGRVNTSAYGNDPANWRTAPKTPGAPLPTGDIPPAIVTQPVSTSAVEGQSASFTVNATGSALGYIWTYNGKVRPGSTATLTLNNLRLSDAGTYACFVFNSAGSVQSSNATLTVRSIPRITQNPVSRAVYIKPDAKAANLPNGTNVTFTVAATSSEPPISYQWRFNGSNIPGAVDSSYTVANVQLDDEGDYTAAITDGTGTIYSLPARLVPWLQPVIIQKPTDVTVAAGSDFSVSVEISGNPAPFAYSWRRNLGSLVVNTNSGSYKTNFITLNTEDARLGLTNNIQSSNFVMRLVVFNDANTAPGVTTTFNVTVLEDSDRDGIPNAIETGLGLDANNVADAAGDLDLDGMSNRAEYLAGTDPANSLSYLKIEQSVVPGTATVQFAGVSNHTYSVQFTDDLGAAAWSKLTDLAARSTNYTQQILDPTWTTNRFYRLATPRQQ